jgi:outer membrane lipoprotein-sorting protein
VIGGALVTTGYKVDQAQKNKDAPKTVATTDKAAVRACQKVFQDHDLCKFTGNYNVDNLSYVMSITTSGASSTFQSDGKGNTSLTATVNGTTTSFIQIGSTSYMKDNSDGQWFKFAPSDNNAPKPANPTTSITVGTTADESKNSTLSYKKLPKETCGKLTCFKYQMIDTANPGATTYFWFDDQHYQLQHYSTTDAKGSTDIVITYQPVTVTAPTPTKEFSSSFDEQALQAAQAAAAAASTQQQ